MAKTTTPDTSSPETPAPEAAQKTLVEKTPLGLSAEQMQKSNPEAVQKLQDDAAAKAKAESAQALASLKAAFPDDLEFATTAHAEGMNVDQAKAKRYDEVSAKVKTLETENAELKKKSENLDVTFGSDNDEDPKAGANAEGEDWENEAASIWNKDKKIQAEFGGNKTSFFAYYKRRPDEFK